MPKNTKLKTAATGLVLALGLAACSPIIAERGYIIDERDLDALQPGLHAKQDVSDIMGTPSTVATVKGETWYYISSRVETVAFFRPAPIERTVIAIYFDQNDGIEEISYVTLEDGQEVELVDRRTPTRGKELTIFEEIFGSIGRFNRLAPGQPGQ